MKKIVILSFLLAFGLTIVFAQKSKKEKRSEIKFDKMIHNFGTFSEDEPVVTCTFGFTNTGEAPLIIHQALASCGCTVPVYTKTPIKPGEKGEIAITYDGTGKFPGIFKKTITIRSNATNDVVRLVVEGDMQVSKKQKAK